MNNYTLYRLREATLAQRITEALSHYSIHNAGALPRGITVNPKDLESAREIVRALDLTLPVKSNGGCLQGEVWLQNGGEP
jgi:hypothetical protein